MRIKVQNKGKFKGHLYTFKLPDEHLEFSKFLKRIKKKKKTKKNPLI